MIKTLKYLSISQLNLHKKNPRRWCLEYLEGIKEPSGVHLEFGNQFHIDIELYLKGQKIKSPHIQTIEKWSKDFEDFKHTPPKSWAYEEDFLTYIDISIPKFKGRIDMFCYKEDLNTLYIFDHKTCTKGYEENEKTIRNNWQLALYALVLGQGMANLNYVLGHNQFFKRKQINGDLKLNSYNILTYSPSSQHLQNIKRDIIEESHKVLETKYIYEHKGLEGVRETPDNYMWYGKPCELWPCIIGKESVENCKKRILKEL